MREASKPFVADTAYLAGFPPERALAVVLLVMLVATMLLHAP